MRKLVLLVCLITALYSHHSNAAENDNVFTFGVCLSISGEFQESGRKALAGVKLRVDDYNKNVSPGRPTINYVVRDDESSPDVARKNTQLFAQDGIPAVIGPLSTMLVMQMRDIAHEKRLVIISPTVTSPKVGKNRDWVCRLLFDDEFQGTVLARFITQKKGMKRAAAVINDRHAYAASVYNAFKTEFERLGGTIVSTEHYEWVADELKAYDFSEALENINAANPEIVLLPVNSTEVAAIIGQATRMGLNLDFCGGDTWLNELVLLASGNAVEGSYYVSGINFDSDTPEMEHYYDLYDNSNDVSLQASSVMGYDAASLLIEALKNGTDAESIHDGLYQIKDFKLATGTITVDPERGSEKTAFINRIERDGDGFAAKVVDEIKP